MGGNAYVGGRLGVGTTTPGSELDVVGSACVQGWDAVFKSLDTGEGVNRTFHLIGTYHGWDAEAIYVPGYNYYNPAGGDVNKSYAKRVHFGRPERMTIDLGTGNVGIGTVNPSLPLHISNSEARIRLESTATSAKIWDIVSGGGGAQTPGVFAIQDITGGATPFKMFGTPVENTLVINSGNIGIGTTSPAEKLEVVGSIRVNATAGENHIKFATGLANDIGFFGRPDDNAVGMYDWANRRGIWYYLPSPNRLDIYLNTYFSGNVGIGTQAPAEKLHVIGNVRIDDAYKLMWSDVNLYRGAADVLKTDDNFDALALRIGGVEVITSNRVLQNVSASVAILTDLPLHVAGDDTEISTTSTSYPSSDQKYFNLNLFAGAYSFSRLLASIEGKATSGYQLTVGIYVDGSLMAEISWTETSYKLKTATISLSGLDPTIIHQVGIRLKVTGGTGYVRTVDFCLVK